MALQDDFAAAMLAGNVEPVTRQNAIAVDITVDGVLVVDFPGKLRDVLSLNELGKIGGSVGGVTIRAIRLKGSTQDKYMHGSADPGPAVPFTQTIY